MSVLLASVVALTSVPSGTTAQQRDVIARVRPVRIEQAVQAGDSSRPIPLINIDEEMGGYLKDAREMIARKDYARAIEVLHALLSRVEQCFVPTSDPRRYVSLALRVTGVIGKMPEEGLKLYRRLYDPEAEQLFRRGAEDRDEALLGDVARRFFHTCYGDDALNLLGAIYFDRGEFSQAARCWGNLLRAHSQSDVDPVTLLVKIVVAHHFAGERGRADEAMKLLARQHPQGEALLAGKKQNAAVFARKMLASPPPRYAAVAAELGGWPCLAGAPDSVAVMSPCRPVLYPRWTWPGGKIDDNPNVQSVIGNIALRRSGPSSGPPGAQQRRLVLREGQVFLTDRTGGGTRRTALPAVIHPVVVDRTVLYRGSEGVAAYDLYTGKKLWASFAFPLYRPLSGAARYPYYYNPSGAALADTGMYTLTVGEGKVFAVGRFLPTLAGYYVRIGRSRQTQRPANTSVLAAFSLTGEGRLLWRVGDGEGSAEIVQVCKFLTAPTYSAGRVYVMAGYMQAYHLLCMDADNAQLLWSAMVGQIPVPSRRGPYRHGQQDRGSPPAVADGRVFAVTNAGVLAAFDARTGTALWAYQYPSSAAPVLYRQKYTRPGRGFAAYPPNPIVVTKGKAISLPADCEQLLALRVDTGELAWSVSRDRQRHLAAIDDSRLLLSGGSLLILDAAGKKIWQADNLKGVFGRAAVTRDAVLASGEGRIIRVSLSDFSVTRPPLVRTDGILGNLISVEGKLLAANAAGVSAYFAYADARSELSQRIRKAAAEDLAGLLYQRGMNAFNAGRPDEAMPDFANARQRAQQTSDAALLAKAEQALYRTYVSLGNRPSGSTARHSFFTKALAVAYSDRSRGEMLVRLSKHYEQIGQHAAAAELAHRLTVEYADTELVDEQIGAEADPFVRDDPDTPRTSGYELGHRRISELIARHGQKCYAGFDAKAKVSLDSAAGANDPEACLRVVETYRHSIWAPPSLLLASESYFGRAGKAPRDERGELLALSDQYLGRIIRDYSDSRWVASAWLGLAMIRQQRNPRIVWLALRGLEKLPATDRAMFGGASGTVGEILRRFRSRRRPLRPGPYEQPGFIQPPLAQLIFAEGAATILRGSDARAVRLGDSVFLLREDRLSLFDTAAKTYKEAIKWETTLPVNKDRIYRHPFSAWAFTISAGLTDDAAMLAVITRGGFVGVEVEGGKVVWKHDLAQPAVSRMYAVTMAGDQFVVLTSTGDISVWDKRTGERVRQHRIARNQLSFRVPPQVAGGMLLVGHGRTEMMVTLFDMNTWKSLGTVVAGRFGVAQACLTADGLLVVSNGNSLKLIEPVSGMDRPIWSVGLGRDRHPRILFLTDTHVLVLSDRSKGLMQLRSLADDGRVVMTYRTDFGRGRKALPVRATVVGNRLYVLGGSTFTYSHISPGASVASYAKDPSLHAFDLATGKRLWKSVDLSPVGGGTYVYVMPFEIGRRYICALSKAQPFTRPATLRIIDSRTGQEAQDPITVPGVRAAKRSPHQYMMLGASPVMTDGRLILDTPKGVMVYGKKD